MLQLKKNVYKNLFLSFVAIALCVCTFSYPCHAFATDTHEYVTKVSLGIVEDVHDDHCKDFYNGVVAQTIEKFSTQPDIDENNGLFKWHYYNPITGKNFVKGDVTALTKFNEHYNSAIMNYNKNNYQKTWDELGRAIHFLEDINTPVHTNSQDVLDATSYLSFHVKFESYISSIQKGVEATMKLDDFSYFRDNSTTQIAKKHANMSADNFYSLHKNLETEETIAKNSLSNAQKCVAGVLYKFYTDVSK